MTMSAVIETQALSRVYKTYRRNEGGWNAVKGFFNRQEEIKVALQPTTLTIEAGQIVGLVGANGAGKTTLLKILSGLIFPSSGDVKVLGYKPFERKAEFLRQISILLGQKAQLWWDLPAADSFNLLTSIYSLDPAQARKDWLELADRLGCMEQLNVQLRRLSLGERMKMEIIGSLLHRPKILYLDEPTIGLDVLAQNTIRAFLAEYVERFQPTIILTSHYMDDISQLADRLLLIGKGAIVYDGTVDNFVRHAEKNLNLDVKSEETDFEEVIHKYFAQESGSSQTRRPLPT
jgi:ABC-2 type transport system ATP-binding protein